MTPTLQAELHEALKECAEYIRIRHNANLGWWNDSYAWRMMEDVIKPALAKSAPHSPQDTKEASNG